MVERASPKVFRGERNEGYNLLFDDNGSLGFHDTLTACETDHWEGKGAEDKKGTVVISGRTDSNKESDSLKENMKTVNLGFAESR